VYEIRDGAHGRAVGTPRQERGARKGQEEATLQRLKTVEKKAKKEKAPKAVKPKKARTLESTDTEKPSPRQKRLPEMDDPAMEELEAAAEVYAQYRDRRMAHGKKESEQKKEIIKIMHKNNKTTYVHAGLTILLESTGEKLKVKIAGVGNSDKLDPGDEDFEEGEG
jgi:hypothetical protein